MEQTRLIILHDDSNNFSVHSRESNSSLLLRNDDHLYVRNIGHSGYKFSFNIISVNDIDSLKKIMINNTTVENTPFYINYIMDLGFRTFPEFDCGSDDLLNLTEQLKDTPGFERLKWRFSNSWDIYGHREKQRSQWFLKQIVHISQQNIIMDLANFDVVDFYKTLLPNSQVNFHTCFDVRWLSENLSSEPYINNNENKTKHFLCLNRLWKPHRTDIWHYINEQSLMDKFHYSYITAGIFLEEETEKLSAEIDAAGYYLPMSTQDTPPRNIINNCYAFLNTETFFYKYDIDAPKWGEGAVAGIDPPEGWLSDTMFDHAYITEKSFKSAYCELPMLVVGLPNTLTTWKRMGFESFPEFFDESYDSENDDNKRMQMVQDEIEKFCNTDIKDIHTLYYSDAVQQKLKRNKNNLYRMIRENRSWEWAKFKYSKGVNPQVDEVFNSEF